ncbi:MDR family MFS transporter [Fructilactobacillus florum]|uniref:MDR family MFS transporter n=1 Tax=Fructilactobacillus florum TaxID=640331 RepID=UPI00028D06E3|nr:MFS transporter [Fructilactobacillus florum]EKK20466.1 multidrug transport protein, major facilitator superfamily [Fructilactobacillus florum 2F]
MARQPKKEISLLAVLVYSLLLNSGAALMWPLTTVYMHGTLHESLTVAGAVLFVMSCFMVLGNYLGGQLFDRWSPYQTALISITVALGALVTLIFYHGWPMFAIMLFVYGLGQGASLTLLNAYAAKVRSRSTRSVFNSLYIGVNLGVVVGTASVGYLLKFGIPVVFSVASLFYLILLLMTFVSFNVDFSSQPLVAHQPQLKQHSASQRGNPRLVWLICTMVFFIYLSYTLWESVMPVHMESLHISFEQYSLIWPVNGLLIVIGQPIINRVGLHFNMIRQIAVGVLIFAASFIMLIWAKNYLWFVIIMVVLTFGEMNGLPAIPAWIDSLADAKAKGRYQAMFNIFMSFGRAVGPLFGGLMVEWFNYPILFATAAGLIIVSLGLVLSTAATNKDSQ